MAPFFMSIKVITKPEYEPIGIEDVKNNSNIVHDHDDQLLFMFIKDAREYIERYCGIALITQTIDIYLDNGFQECIEIPVSPLQTVNSINYIDSDGVTQTLSNTVYKVDSNSLVGRISLAYGESWPVVRDEINNVTIQAVVGYGDPTNVPMNLKNIILRICDHWYEHRSITSEMRLDNVPAISFENMLARYRNHI